MKQKWFYWPTIILVSLTLMTSLTILYAAIAWTIDDERQYSSEIVNFSEIKITPEYETKWEKSWNQFFEAKTGDLFNPNYKQVKEFLRNDKIDQKRYIPNEYMCCDFSRDLVLSAKEKGIRAGWVFLEFQKQSHFEENGFGSGHNIVCFRTTDKGLLFIEPQNDLEVKIEIGKNYWDSYWKDRCDNWYGRYFGKYKIPAATNALKSFYLWGHYNLEIDYDATILTIKIYWLDKEDPEKFG